MTILKNACKDMAYSKTMFKYIYLIFGILLAQDGLANIHVERVMCSISASIKYEIPVNIMLAIAEKEGGRPGQVVKNKNGTVDVGPMQFNTVYLKELKRFGIDPIDISAPGCFPYDVAAWRIRGHIKNDTGDIWTRASNYHSRTPKYNQIYRRDLMEKAVKWADWVDANREKITVVVIDES